MKKEELYKMVESTTPHFFGLGFVQCKISEKERIHFYHPALNATVGKEEIYSHRYNFVSKIFKGSIRNQMYHFMPYGEKPHYLQMESCNEDIKLTITP